MNRAYAILDLKAVDDDKRILEGIATTPTADRMEDRVNPLGATFKLPLPFLMQHDASPESSVGHVISANVTRDGIKVRIQVERDPLLPELDKAWARIKKGLVRGLSIGFRPTEDPKPIKGTFGVLFNAWEWLELSAVVIAANAEASITSIKSFDQSQRAALGHHARKVPLPGATGTPTKPADAGFFSTRAKGSSMKTIQEQLVELNEKRSTTAMRMKEIGDLWETEGHDRTQAEREELRKLGDELSNIDDDILVKRAHESNIAKAKPVTNGKAPVGYVRKFNDAEERFKGETGLKRAMCNVMAMSEIKQGRFTTPVELAERMWGKTNPTLVAVMKTAVPGAGTDSGEWGAELAAVDNRYTGDFIEYLYGLTVFDQLPLRTVPHNVAIKGQDGAFTGFFIGQSKAIPVSKGDFSSTSTVAYKAAGLTVVSNEWLRDASGDGLALCGQGLREAVAQAVDSLFLSATAASSGVAPAGILNGVSATSSNGTDALSIAADIRALFAPFITAKNLSGGLAWVMTPTTAVALSLMRNALGQAEYPTINGNGGTFMGYPVYIGDNVGTGDVILLKPSDIWKIGDLGVSLSTSDSAMIEQDTAPTGATDTPVAASATMVSMFQEDSTAIKVVRPISWGKRRASAVAYVGDASYGTDLS